MLDTVRSDIARLTASEPTAADKIGVVLLHLGLHAVVSYRLAHWLHSHRLRLAAAVVSYLGSVLTGAQISPRASIGKGLVIYHPQGVVIGAGAVLGEQCTLVHGTVIGQLYGGGDRPSIGDRLFAGTGAKILGRVTIGHDVRVGANSVVITPIPDGASVSGNPARILSACRASMDALDHELAAAPVNGARSAQPVTTDGGPSRAAILERLLPLIASVLEDPRQPIDEGTGLLGEGIGVDSIEILKLVCAIEEEFELTIDERELQPSSFRTVASVVTFIQAQFVHGGILA
jgi:serine O-acetyltransferase